MQTLCTGLLDDGCCCLGAAEAALEFGGPASSWRLRLCQESCDNDADGSSPAHLVLMVRHLCDRYDTPRMLPH